MINHKIVEAAASVFRDHGIDIRCPWNGDLDDVERERFEALCSALDAAGVGLGEPKISKSEKPADVTFPDEAVVAAMEHISGCDHDEMVDALQAALRVIGNSDRDPVLWAHCQMLESSRDYWKDKAVRAASVIRDFVRPYASRPERELQWEADLQRDHLAKSLLAFRSLLD